MAKIFLLSNVNVLFFFFFSTECREVLMKLQYLLVAFFKLLSSFQYSIYLQEIVFI